MEILALMGSPRVHGNTDIVLEAALARVRAASTKVTKLNLGEMHITGCVECFTCQKRTERPNCAVKDGVQKIYREMLRADLILMATPVFCWGPTAQLKAVLDRCYAMCKFRGGDEYDSLLEGKRSALLVTAGGAKDDGADAVAVCYRRLTDFMRVKSVGELIILRLGTPEETRENRRVLRRAEVFGDQIAESIGDS